MSKAPQKSPARVADERHYDALYRGALRSMGASAWKLEPKFKGWPDIYVAPDIHIECKYISWFKAERIKPLPHFEALQIHTLDELVQKGCSCYAALFWWFGDEGGYVQTIEWQNLRATGLVERDWVLRNAHPLSMLRQHVKDTWEVNNGIASIRASALAQVRLAEGPHADQ